MHDLPTMNTVSLEITEDYTVDRRNVLLIKVVLTILHAILQLLIYTGELNSRNMPWLCSGNKNCASCMTR